MQETEVQNPSKLDLLEAKIGQTAKKISGLVSRCDALKRENEQLNDELETLREKNRSLATQIDNLAAENETRAKQGGGKEEIIKRIDKMLEKFGELQI
ncbi:MAG: cell division protein ZapB [bacterium]